MLSAGFICSHKNCDRELIARYVIQNPVSREMDIVSSVGWHEGIFVFPNKTFGKSERKMWCTASPLHHKKGSLEDWQQQIARYCVGNSRLVLGVCAAFASSVLKIFEMENAGFHIVGSSSCGKTTCLKVASSVFGTPVGSWRTTDNGLENLAVQHNDSLLLLDELGQISPYQVGDAVYMLANGASKGRLDKNGVGQKINKWRLLFLSSGETDLSSHMKASHKKTNVGQELRLININATDSSESYGIFENLHEFEDGQSLSAHLFDASKSYKGTAIETFLETVTQDTEAIKQDYARTLSLLRKKYLSKGSEGQDFRVFEKFAFLGIIGEYARFVTNWPEGEAIRGCMQCFQDWLETNEGFGNRESKQILTQIQLFFEQNTESQLQDINNSNKHIMNMVGYKDKDFFYITPQTFRSVICQGWVYKTVVNTLLKANILKKNEQNEVCNVKRIGERTVRVYTLDRNLIEKL